MEKESRFTLFLFVFLVRRSKNPSLVGCSGVVIHETENTFKLVTPANQLKGMVFWFFLKLQSTSTDLRMHRCNGDLLSHTCDHNSNTQTEQRLCVFDSSLLHWHASTASAYAAQALSFRGCPWVSQRSLPFPALIGAFALER